MYNVSGVYNVIWLYVVTSDILELVVIHDFLRKSPALLLYGLVRQIVVLLNQVDKRVRNVGQNGRPDVPEIERVRLQSVDNEKHDFSRLSLGLLVLVVQVQQLLPSRVVLRLRTWRLQKSFISVSRV